MMMKDEWEKLKKLSSDDEAKQMLDKIKFVCLWLQAHGASKSDMVKYMCLEWDNVAQLRSNIKETHDILRFKKQAKDLGFDL